MRILHTADWHLGKKLEFFNRLEEQEQVLREICTISEEQNVDLVIVAGDLFDSATPSNEAMELLYKTLKKLANNGKIPVIAIAGNHDSPSRINVADVLARENGIILIGYPTDVVPTLALENGFKISQSEIGFIEVEIPEIPYPIRILHTAYANEIRLKEYFGEEKERSLQESLGAKWKKLADSYCDKKGVNILTSHLYMLKRGGAILEEPDGERPLNIGTADLLYSDAIPAQIQYVALGHLHRFQDVGAQQPVIYSGSPLTYSFAEAGQQKYVSIIDIEPDSEPVISKIPLHSGKPLMRKTFDNFENAINWLSENKNCLVELTLEVENYLKSEERKLLYQTHDGIIHLIPKVKNVQNSESSTKTIDLSKNIDELFKDYFKSKNSNLEPNEELMTLFKEILL